MSDYRFIKQTVTNKKAIDKLKESFNIKEGDVVDVVIEATFHYKED